MHSVAWQQVFGTQSASAVHRSSAGPAETDEDGGEPGDEAAEEADDEAARDATEAAEDAAAAASRGVEWTSLDDADGDGAVAVAVGVVTAVTLYVQGKLTGLK